MERRRYRAGEEERRWRGECLWSAYQANPVEDLRKQLIEHYRPLALLAVKRLRCQRDEDLEQVAMIGLVKAVDRFDPARGNGFYAFAMPTIMGEIKRYLRDHSHLVRCPRSLHDLRDRVRAREQGLTRERGQAPTLAEVAEALDVDLDQVVEAMALEEIGHPCSLDGPLSSTREEQPLVLEECIGTQDDELEQTEKRIIWDQMLNDLGPRLKRLIQLRYFQELTQRETGQRLGISQMHVSRLERRALERLRTQSPVAEGPGRERSLTSRRTPG